MSFPQHRAEIEEETSDLQSFFQASIEDDQRMIEIYQKLLSFNLEPKEAECFRLGMRVQSNQIERTESMLDQMRLVFDKNIQDKETLERRAQNIEEKNRPLDLESSELGREMSTKCSKSNLGAN